MKTFRLPKAGPAPTPMPPEEVEGEEPAAEEEMDPVEGAVADAHELIMTGDKAGALAVLREAVAMLEEEVGEESEESAEGELEVED